MTRDEMMIEYASTIARELPGIRPMELARIAKLARTHGVLAVNMCNRELSKAENTRVQNIEHEITELLFKHGANAKFGGDPRGCTVKIILASGRANDFVGEGVCVPQ